MEHINSIFSYWTRFFSEFSVHVAQCVWNMFISLLVNLFICVCNSTERCSQGRISSVFLSLTCSISKDGLQANQADRQSDKTAEQMWSVHRDVTGDRW